MTIIRTPGPDEVTGDAAELYAADIASFGYVPSHTRVMANNPAAYRRRSMVRSDARISCSNARNASGLFAITRVWDGT